ncbi:MAG: DUF169 domain-containing protein [Deltaproteobacteria bacterium]|nr:DUF169 domain-containing protein [Deltaproteobacteria bacterium]MBW2071999.1 DUF169 domain-containing protein [Deltaproteobacteria bacterium]
MADISYRDAAEFIRNDLRLKTLPVAVKFLGDDLEFPEKTRRPYQFLGKRITICQAVTMARLYGWTVGLTKEDIICVPALLAFGLSGAEDPGGSLTSLFCEINFHQDRAQAHSEVQSMSRFANNEFQALLLAPLGKGLFDPDVVACYGNPAQIMRLTQAWTFKRGNRVKGLLGGKVECSEYLIAPLKTESPRIAIPGMGDRIFSMTQDDEMVFSIPGRDLSDLLEGLQQAGNKIGARYPVTFYQNFEPVFPKQYKELAQQLELF